jgi:2-polyprenyl-3-methyl-5-hydroxy-6-metoxy-1,4-benzoquinol methylase
MVARKVPKALAPNLALDHIRDLIAEKFKGKKIRVYEAGGGSLSILPLSSLDHPVISVVDIDETQLRNNNYAEVKVLGDIQTYTFPANSFDLVVCKEVIEHLDSPDQAIRKFHDALAPGSLMFIAAPNPASLSGFVTKYSPHWFHVWFYRVILRRRNAGQPGQPPFPTVYHRIVHPAALINFCKKLGFSVVYFTEVTGWNYLNIREARPIFGRLIYAAVGMLNFFTFGRRDLRNSDYLALFEKDPTVGAIESSPQAASAPNRTFT